MVSCAGDGPTKENGLAKRLITGSNYFVVDAPSIRYSWEQISAAIQIFAVATAPGTCLLDCFLNAYMLQSRTAGFIVIETIINCFDLNCQIDFSLKMSCQRPANFPRII